MQSTIVAQAEDKRATLQRRLSEDGRCSGATVMGGCVAGVSQKQSIDAGIVEEEYRYVDGEGNEYRYRVDDKDRALISDCVAAVPEVHVPQSLGGHPVVAVGEGAFSSAGRLPLSTRIAMFSEGNAANGKTLRGLGKSASRNSQVERVVLPEGVVSIGRAAFRGCANLREVALPDTLEEVCDFAFSCSGIRTLELPQNCTRLSERALRLGPETVLGVETTYRSKLAHIGVHRENPLFSMRGGLLCEAVGAGRYKALLCPNEVNHVTIAREIATIAPGVFAGTERIGKLRVAQGVVVEHPDGLLPHGRCDELTVDFPGAQGVWESAQVKLPQGPLAGRILGAACVDGKVDVRAFLSAYDAALPAVEDRLCQAKLMLARLADPVMLGDSAKAAFREALEPEFEALCVHFGARCCWEDFEHMADAGLLDAPRVSQAVALLTSRGDATASAFLLELKRRRFTETTWDYDL